MAAEAATAKEDMRYFRVGALAIRGDGRVVMASNGPTRDPCFLAHAETRLARKLDVGATVYVARIAKDGSFKMAKPCFNCERVLRSVGVNRVFWTNDMNSYEGMYL